MYATTVSLGEAPHSKSITHPLWLLDAAADHRPSDRGSLCALRERPRLAIPPPRRRPYTLPPDASTATDPPRSRGAARATTPSGSMRLHHIMVPLPQLTGGRSRAAPIRLRWHSPLAQFPPSQLRSEGRGVRNGRREAAMQVCRSLLTALRSLLFFEAYRALSDDMRKCHTLFLYAACTLVHND